MNQPSALEKAIELAKAAIESQTERIPVVLDSNGADNVADFIETLAKRLEAM